VGAPCPDIPEFGCSVCGSDGVCITIPDGIFGFPGQPPVECRLLQNAGLNGEIPLDQCPFLSGLVNEVCGCQSPKPATPTTPHPAIPAPVTPDTTTVVPTPAPSKFGMGMMGGKKCCRTKATTEAALRGVVSEHDEDAK
jgi:hypothetical protein